MKPFRQKVENQPKEVKRRENYIDVLSVSFEEIRES
jgi:hypothetical protein